jgi:hypothetical protein
VNLSFAFPILTGSLMTFSLTIFVKEEFANDNVPVNIKSDVNKDFIFSPSNFLEKY